MLGIEARALNVAWHPGLASKSDPEGRHVEERVSYFTKAKDVVPLIPCNSGRGWMMGWHHHVAQKSLQKDAVHS